MALHRVIIQLTILILVNSKVVKNEHERKESLDEGVQNIDDVFNGGITECFTKFSYICIQKKTLKYLKQLNNLSEVSVVGDYVKFVRLNATKLGENNDTEEETEENNSEELTHMIDKAIDGFFDNHIIRFNALGRDFSIPKNVEEFVGRKKRKGGGGGDGGMMMGGHDGGHFGNKKMMMMAMMCMKMKMMMMLPAMMGMMGMMSFKGMMFSMMSFMISKMMLLMKILEKKGGAGGFGGGGGSGGDGGWAASAGSGGGGGGAWMPAGDFGGGGGYDANGQWQSRSILEHKEAVIDNKPIISYVAPVVTYNNPNKLYKKNTKNVEGVLASKHQTLIKSRRKRSIIDAIKNSYIYWINQILGTNNKNRRTSNIPKYKIVNGVKYVFYPYRQQKYYKYPKEIQSNKIINTNEEPSIITAADFNKGEIMDGAVESRMSTKKIMKIKDTVNDALDDNPWE